MKTQHKRSIKHVVSLFYTLIILSLFCQIVGMSTAGVFCYAETPQHPSVAGVSGNTSTQNVSTTPKQQTKDQSDAYNPVELTSDQMKQYYFLNFRLHYKALEMHQDQAPAYSTIVKPDSDLGTFDNSWRNMELGAVSPEHDEVLQAFRRVKFRFFDKTLNRTADIKELKFTSPFLGIRRVFFGFDPDHEYQITIDGKTVPSPNALGFSQYHYDHTAPIGDKLTFQMNKNYPKGSPVRKADPYLHDPSSAYDDYVDRFYYTDLFMAPLEIIYANSEDDAKDALTIEKHPTLTNKHTFKYNDAKIFKRLRITNNEIPFPKEEPKKTGYTFLGWGYNLLFPKKADGTPDDKKSPYTIWDLLECTRQGSLTAEQEKQCYSDYTKWAKETLPFSSEHMRSYYAWSIIRDGVINKYGMTKDFLEAESPVFIVFPVWKKVDAHTVTFMNDGRVYREVKVSAGTSIKDGRISGQAMPENPSKDGYTFKEWNTQADGQGTSFSADTPVNSDMTVYAVYTKNPKPTPTPVPPAPKPKPTPVPHVPSLPLPQPQLQIPAARLVPAETLQAPAVTPAPEPAPAPAAPDPALPQTGDECAPAALLGSIAAFLSIGFCALGFVLRARPRTSARA